MSAPPPAGLITLAAVFLCAWPAQLAARSIPTYRDVQRALPSVWKRRFPLKATRFNPHPKRRGVLRVVHRGRRVYYYHFQVELPRPFRDGAGRLKVRTGRTLELWVRFRPWLAGRRLAPKKPAAKKTRGKKGVQAGPSPYDLSFVREDLLPGRYRRYIKEPK